MRHKIFFIAALMFIALPWLAACSDDNDLDGQSIITIDNVQYTDFDRWLRANYVNTYNVDFQYRFQDIETDRNYYLIPADYNQSVELAHTIKYACLESFDEVAGIDFTRANFPKQIYLVGNWEWRNNGTYTLGTAEGGKKIFLAGVNEFDSHRGNIDELNYYYLHTIFHEFTHILNQTKDYASDYQLITPNYVTGAWNEAPNDTGYLHRGFITDYAQESAAEDYAEMFSGYVTHSAAWWQAQLEEAGPTGRSFLELKLTSVREYMRDSWGIDMDALRDVVLRREADIAAGKVDLTSLKIE